MDNALTPEIDDINRPYWESLAHGSLRFQCCTSCGQAWLPARNACPSCLSRNWTWRDASGKGKIISWVVYHVAYHPAFKNRLPYNVALIELEEGPRLLSNVLDDSAKLSAYASVDLVVQQQDGVYLPMFSLASKNGQTVL